MTKVMEIEDITHMFVAFDTKEKTFVIINMKIIKEREK